MRAQFSMRKLKIDRNGHSSLVELSIDPNRAHNRNANASQATGLDQMKAKKTATYAAGFVSQKLPFVLVFASILAALALAACGPKTSPPPKVLGTPSPRPTLGESPTTTSPPEPSATSSPDYTPWEAGDRGVDDQDVVPKFPWPPPKASTSDMIPRELLVGNAAHPTLSTVAQAIESAFAQAGYGQKSYYSVPGGFAMASQIEQINQDGTPKDSVDRWSLETPPLRKFSLGSYLTALFTAQSGYYRVIVFVVTAQAFPQRDVKVTSEQSKGWVSGGLNKLPDKIGNQEYSATHSCTALIYEFKKTGKHAELVDPSQIPGKTHLDKAGLMAAFAKPR
jgi:hypothetical protein